MKSIRRILSVLAFVLIAAGATRERPKPVRVGVAKPNPSVARAVAVIEGRSGSRLGGQAVFERNGAKVMLRIAVEGGPPGPHGVHLHERGNCSAEDALSAGPHWNPTGEAHGRWGFPPFHRGDIGNLVIGEDGRGSLTVTTDLWTIGGDPATDVLDRAIILHEAADDFVTQPTGNAGGRIGCGVVRLEE